MKKFMYFGIFLMFVFLFIFNVNVSYADGVNPTKQDLSISTYNDLVKQGVIANDVTYEMWKELNQTSEPTESGYANIAASYSLKKGDILISNATSSAGLTGHAGIAVSSKYILHIAGANQKPALISLSSWKSRYGKPHSWRSITWVYRVSNSSVANKAADWAYKNFYKKNYTYKIDTKIYSLNPTYCSKIVWQAYYFGTGSLHVINVPLTHIAKPYDLPVYFNKTYKPKYITGI